MGFSFVVAVWITGPRFSLAKKLFRHAAPPEPDPQDPLILELAPQFGFTTPMSLRSYVLNIAGYTTKTLFTQVLISRETRGRRAYIMYVNLM